MKTHLIGVLEKQAMNDPGKLIAEAKERGEGALGSLLELYRNYLRLLAKIEVGRRLQGKLDASDLVQETFLDAHRNFVRFRGTDEPQFVCWLRQILAAKVADAWRRYLGAQGRDVRLEQDLAAQIEDSSRMLSHGLAASLTSPSLQAAKREQDVLLANALEKLPEDYRGVIVLRHFYGHTFPEIAAQMGRSQDSVKKLWLRALARLRQAFGEGD